MILLIGVSALLAIMAVVKVGGIGAVVEQTPASYWQLFQPLSDVNFPWLAILLGYPIMGVWFWCTDQSMVQSVLGAKNLKQGQLGANFTAWLKIIDIPLFILPGILCFLLLPNLQNSTDAYLQLVEKVFPHGLLGLVVVIMSAALISTIAASLNSLSTVFTMDIFLKNHKADNRKIKQTGRIVVLAGAALSVVLAICITFIQGLSFFNIFQSVLGFLAPPMTATFLFTVFWKRTSAKAINLTLIFGTLFSIGIAILFYTGLIFSNLHFLYISFGIFVILAAFIFIFSLLDKQITEYKSDYKPLKINNSVKIAWGVLVAIMVGLYIFFN
jgi:SSS family solute:Na+ symporter